MMKGQSSDEHKTNAARLSSEETPINPSNSLPGTSTATTRTSLVVEFGKFLDDEEETDGERSQPDEDADADASEPEVSSVPETDDHLNEPERVSNDFITIQENEDRSSHRNPTRKSRFKKETSSGSSLYYLNCEALEVPSIIPVQNQETTGKEVEKMEVTKPESSHAQQKGELGFSRKKGKLGIRAPSFPCNTCGKNFPSYQALGGHTQSHSRHSISKNLSNNNDDNDDGGKNDKEKGSYICINCKRRFKSQRALSMHRTKAHGT